MSKNVQLWIPKVSRLPHCFLEQTPTDLGIELCFDLSLMRGSRSMGAIHLDVEKLRHVLFSFEYTQYSIGF